MGLPLHRCHLLQPSHVALPAVEARREKRVDELARNRRPDDLGAEAEHVHVVVLDALVRGVHVVTDRRADTGDLACGHCRADAGAADEDAALRAAVELVRTFLDARFDGGERYVRRLQKIEEMERGMANA